jgi:hypothetical protein
MSDHPIKLPKPARVAAKLGRELPMTRRLYDKRLLGTWKSDRKRTAAEIAARRDMPADKKAALSALFGRLELRYTRAHCYSTLDGTTERTRYSVVARDAESVAIVNDDTIYHVHFEEDSYWITLGSSNVREFFRRIG